MPNDKIKGYIICENTAVPEVPIIVSDTDSKHRIIIKTNLQDADVQNRNKRIYPKSVLEKGLATDYIRERIATKTFFGEAGELGWLASINYVSLIAG